MLTNHYTGNSVHCQTVMGFGQDRLTQNKLSILNGGHIMTLYTVSHFDNILPQNLHDPGRKEKEGHFSVGFGFSRPEKVFFLSQEIQLYPYAYSNCMPQSLIWNAVPCNSSEVLQITGKSLSHLDFLITGGEGCFQSSPGSMQAGSLPFPCNVDVNWELQTTGAVGNPVSSRCRVPREAVCCVLGMWNGYDIWCPQTCSSVGLSLLDGLPKQTRD